jgi:WD40-like Beta Propeller Repeat
MKITIRKILLPPLLVLGFFNDAFAITELDLISTDSSGAQFSDGAVNPSISSDGRYVVFARIVPTDPFNVDNEIILKDLQTNISTQISPSNKNCTRPIISGNGRFIFYFSYDEIIPGISNGYAHIYVYDRTNQTTSVIDFNMQGQLANYSSSSYSISYDGVYVAYHSQATNLVSDDTNSLTDVFLLDRANLTLERVSVTSTGEQLVKSGSAGDINVVKDLSDDGRYILFSSSADNLSFDNTIRAFIHDRQTHETIEFLRDDLGNLLSLGYVTSGALSSNGRYVAFNSNDEDLPGANGSGQAYLHDRSAQSNILISAVGATPGNSYSLPPRVSASGRYVTFASNADNLIPSDTNNGDDIFVVDSDSGAIARITEDLFGTGANVPTTHAPIQSTGQSLVYSSRADNLVSWDINDTYDAFKTDNPVLASHFEFIMSPTNLPWILTASGGNVYHNATVKNIDSVEHTITLYRRLYAPDGTAYPLISDNSYIVPAGAFINEQSVGYTLPASFPAGRYQVTYFVFENDIFVDSGSYFFFKQ